jgi:hypothetical protein
MALEFERNGKIVTLPPPLVEIPLPVIFDILPWSPPSDRITIAFLEAAKTLGTFAVVRQSDLTADMDDYLSNTILFVDGDTTKLSDKLLSKCSIVELPDSDRVMEFQHQLKKKNPHLVVFIRAQITPETSERIAGLAQAGAEVLHLVADEWGFEYAEKPLFIKERIKQIHLNLVEKGLRDQVTLVGSGGVAMAEHMAKLIICGADALTVDIPLLVAMECRVCRRCKEGIACPVELENVDPAWGAARIKNLIAAWHSQLLEIMGAMGIREARRLRGEMGRAMFFEDLEKEIFASMEKGVKRCT